MNETPTRLPTLALVLAAGGCSLPERSHLTQPDPLGVVTVDPAEVAAAPDAPEPEIAPATHVAAGRLFQSNRQFSKAIEQYHKAIAADSNYVEAYHRLGVVAGYVGRHAEAEAALRQAIQLDPGSSSLRNNLGFEYVMQQKWTEAAREFQRAISIDPGLDRAYINLALALAAQGRFEEAFSKFRWVLPEPDAYYNLGLTYLANRRYEEARSAFDRVLEIDPGFEAARRQLEGLSEPDPDEAAFIAHTSNQPAAFVPEETFISAVTQADWSVIRDTVSPSVAADEGPEHRPGDFDGDGDVDSTDAAEFGACLFGHVSGVPPDCRAGDLDDDGDVDLLDFLQFQKLFVEP